VILILLVLAIILTVALFHTREGLFGAAVVFLNVVIAGFATFCLFEPLASWLGGLAPAMDAYADAVCMTLTFLLCLLLLRFATGLLVPSDLEFPEWPRRIGGGLFGLVTGYVVSGLFLCLLQTLPLPQQFLGYNAKGGMGLGSPDRVWLATVHRASGQILHQAERKWFDADGSFIPRYARYRRMALDQTVPRRNRGELPVAVPTRHRED